MKIFVSTGEVSGDLHLSYLVTNILKIDKDIKFYGVAGEHCKTAGVEIIHDIKDLAVMGFTEAIKKYHFLKKKSLEYLEFIKENKIDKVILVDYGGFNLAFLKLLKKEVPNVEVYYYIPPKLWVWGEKRINTLKLADHILVIFPWEVEFYKKHGLDVVYYGNPFSEKYSLLEKKGDKILLLPGSRKQEIHSLMPVMLEIVKSMPDKEFLLKLHSSKVFGWIDVDILKYPNLSIEKDTISLEEVAKECNMAIAASGTVTLELALMGIPTIVLYKTSCINAFIARHILKLGFVSLPNLTLNKEVYPELLQEKCTKDKILFEIDRFEKNIDQIESDILKIREKLSGKNVVENYARYIIERK